MSGTPLAPRIQRPRQQQRLLIALAAQALTAVAVAVYGLSLSTNPRTGTTLTDYIDVALTSCLVTAYGLATLLLGTFLGNAGHPRITARALQIAGGCMLVAAVENLVEDGFKVAPLSGLWIMLITISWLCLLLAGGRLVTTPGTRLLGLLLLVPPPLALAFDFYGWIPAVAFGAVGVAFLIRRWPQPVGAAS